MGYINEMYGHRGSVFIAGFLAAMDTYSIGQRCSGSAKEKRKDEMKRAVAELCSCPEDYDADIEKFF